jgi:carboxyl-terminal processing protease
MKGNRIVVATLLCLIVASLSDAGDRREASDLHAVVATVSQILEEAEYTQHPLDANMGQQILETYLEGLDVNKLFFTQEEIDQLRKEYSSSLADDIRLGNLTPAKEIYAIFRKRVDERVTKIDAVLKERYDFSLERTVIADRTKERWPANASEADGIWSDKIQSELLEAKLRNGSTKPEPEAIARHYREIGNQIDSKDETGVLRIFLEAVAQTYDPHSEYLGPSDLDQFKIDTRLTISGVGAQIHMDEGYATIDRIFSRGPVDRSGRLHVGDKIVGIAEGNGPFVNVLHANLDQITEMVLGKSGTIVRFQFLSSHTKNPSEPQIISLVREEIQLTEDAAQAQIVEMEVPGGIQKLGWLTVPSFYEDPEKTSGGTSVTHDVATLLSRLERERIQGLVIDLRDNAGGSVAEAVRMTGLFMNRGPIVQLKDPNGEIYVVNGQPGKALYDGPLVILENKLTASASEIFSAAMQDRRRAAIVGDSGTFGKGSVQAVIEINRFIEQIGDLPNLGGALKITIEKIYRVTGQSTQVKGVISDVKIPSLTELAVPGEDSLKHRLPYDAIAPALLEPTEGKPLFLDKLRTRSIARIAGNPLFQDLFSEIAWTRENIEKNRVSLNEKIRKNQLAELARLSKKADADRKTARAQDRNKYRQLILADGDKTELRPIVNESAQYASRQSAGPDTVGQPFPDSPQVLPGLNDFDDLPENEAITRETLNILSDLVNLTKAQEMATSRLGKDGSS